MQEKKRPWAPAMLTLRERLDEVFRLASAKVADDREIVAATRCDLALQHQAVLEERDAADSKLSEMREALEKAQQQLETLRKASQFQAAQPAPARAEAPAAVAASEIQAIKEENATLRRAFSQAGTELQKLEDDNTKLRAAAGASPTAVMSMTATSGFGAAAASTSASGWRPGDSLRPPPTAGTLTSVAEDRVSEELRKLEEENLRLRKVLAADKLEKAAPPAAPLNGSEQQSLRQDNTRLRQSLKVLNEERNKLKAEVATLQNERDEARREVEIFTASNDKRLLGNQNQFGSEDSRC